jgi:hypothetical protein
MYVNLHCNIHSAPGKSRALISYEEYFQLQGKRDSHNNLEGDRKLSGASPKTTLETRKGENAFLP